MSIKEIVVIIGIVLIWGLGCYGTINIFHKPPSAIIPASFLFMLFLVAFFFLLKIHCGVRQERKMIEEKCLTANDPKTFLEALEFYSTLNWRDNARTDIPRAKEIGKRFTQKILSEGKDFLSDEQMIELIVLLGRLDMEKEALQCLQSYYNRKT